MSSLLYSAAVVDGRGGEVLVHCQPVGGLRSGCMCGVSGAALPQTLYHRQGSMSSCELEVTQRKEFGRRSALSLCIQMSHFHTKQMEVTLQNDSNSASALCS